MDLRLSADQVAMVIHDPDTRRTTGVNLPVRSQSARELQRLDAGSWKGSKWRGERIPTLSETLRALPRRLILLLELKEGMELLPAVEEAVERHGRPENCLFMSPQAEILLELKERHPGWKSLLLVDHPKRFGSPPLEKFIDQACRAGLEGLSLGRSWLSHDRSITGITKAGLLLSVWTVNDPAEAVLWRNLGAAYITTDFPERLAC